MSGKEMTSGLRLKFSNTPRQFEAGHLSLGATWMFYLPPNQENFSLYGSCNKECLAAAATLSEFENGEKIKIFAASSHAHKYATSIKLSQIRNGQEINRLVDEPYYDRMYQEYKYLE